MSEKKKKEILKFIFKFRGCNHLKYKYDGL